MKNPSIDSKEKQLILKVIENSLGPPGDETYHVILFGSFARGKPRKNSDYDVAIRSSRPIDLATLGFIKESLEESNISRTVDIIDYSRAADDFRHVIDSTGVCWA